MTLLKVLILVLLFGGMVFICGKCVSRQGVGEISLMCVAGFVTVTALTEAVSVVMVAMDSSVDGLAWTNVVEWLVLLATLVGFNWRKFTEFNLPRWTICHMVLALALVGLAVSLVFWHVIPYDADGYATGIASAAYRTNEIYSENPWTGAAVDTMEKRLYISPYPVVIAGFGRLVGVQPASILHTGMPVVVVMLSGMLYYMIGALYFRNSEYRCLFALVMLGLGLLFTSYDVNASTGLLMASWQGGVIVANVFLPAVWYYGTLALTGGGMRSWLFLFFAMAGSLFFSLAGAVLCPLLLVCMVLYYAIAGRNAWYLVGGLFMVLPAIAALVAYTAI